jgi:hypothetical protein
MESLEPRCLLASTITAAFGPGQGGGSQVTVLFNDGTRMSFFAFNPAFAGGLSVTTGLVNGTGIPDVIVGAGPGGAPEVKVFDGAQLLAGRVVATADFLAFPMSVQSGVTVATGHIDNPTRDDVIVGAGPGGGTRIKVFDGADLEQGVAVPTADFTAFDPTFQGRITLAVGPVNGTTHDDLVVAEGAGGAPEVKVFDGAELAQGRALATADFFAFDPAFRGGVTLAVGPVNGTPNADVVVGAGPSGGPAVKVFSGADLAQGQAVATANFFAFAPSFLGGVSVAVGNINGTANDDVIVGAGPGGGPEIKVFSGADLAQGQAVVTADFFALDPAFTGGLQVVTPPLDASGRDAIVAFAGPGGGSQVVVYNNINIVAYRYIPIFSFFAFSPFFVGGFGYGGFFGYGNYFGYGGFLGYGGYGSFGGFSGSTPGFSGSSFSGFSGPSSSGFGSSGFGSSGFGSSGFGSSGFSGGSGGSGGGGGSSLRAAGGSLGVGGKAAGGGLYLAPGQLSLSGPFTASTTTGGPQGPLMPIGELRSAISQAISWWDAAGIDAAQDQELRSTEFQIVNLGSDTMGRTRDGIIHLSPSAAGYGWFADPAGDDFETPTSLGLTASPGTPAANHMDLTTVIAHEMGLVLGLKETSTPGDIMAPYLPAGVRRLPTPQDIDALFSQGTPSG